MRRPRPLPVLAPLTASTVLALLMLPGCDKLGGGGEEEEVAVGERVEGSAPSAEPRREGEGSGATAPNPAPAASAPAAAASVPVAEAPAAAGAGEDSSVFGKLADEVKGLNMGDAADEAAEAMSGAAGLAGEALDQLSEGGPKPHPAVGFSYAGKCEGKAKRAGPRKIPPTLEDCLAGPIVKAITARAEKSAREHETRLEFGGLIAHVVEASDGSETGLVAFTLPFKERGMQFPGVECAAVYEQKQGRVDLRYWRCGAEQPPRFEVRDLAGDRIPEFLLWRLEDQNQESEDRHFMFASHSSSGHWRKVLDGLRPCKGELALTVTIEKKGLQTYCTDPAATDEEGAAPAKRDFYSFGKAIFVRKGDKLDAAIDAVLDDGATGEAAATVALARAAEFKANAKRDIGRAANTRGYRLYWDGDLDGALPLFEAAVAIDPDYGLAHFNAARVYAIRGDLAKTVEHLKLAATLEGGKEHLAAAQASVEFAKVKGFPEFKALYP